MEPALELLTVFSQPIVGARQRLREGISALRDEFRHFPGDVAEIESLFLGPLFSRLRTMTHRTLALEMHVARLQGQLAGATPAARYQSFIDRVGQPEIARVIANEYPVLERQALVCIDQWIRFSLEFLRHLCIDWPQLRKVFSLSAEVGNLVELAGDSGDPHSDGKAVIVLRFASGSRLVYKPRSLAVEQRFQELLSWCNGRGSHPPFRLLRVLDCADHGWVEFVERQTCGTVEEIQRFYRRQGNYLALLYITGATDFHFENLIAAGEHPVLVDLETLLHPRLPGSRKDPALEGMCNSVVSIGLLPRVSYFDGFDKGIDFSGLGATVGQQIDSPINRFESLGTDEMRMVRVERHALAGSHRPTLRGADIAPAAYGPEILQGFVEMYQLLQQHRDALAASDGPLAKFAEVETRFIARATQIYAILLEQSFHPDYLRVGADRDRWFGQLWSQTQEATALGPLVAAERADLDRNDIPLFHSCPGSTDLWTSRGERIANFFDRAPLDSARERLAGLGADDLARQTWLIRAALAKLTPPVDPCGGKSDHGDSMARPADETDDADALAEAICVGDQLAALAWQNADEAGWLGIHRRGRGWFVGSLDLDIENGLPGIALFLAELGVATGTTRFAQLLDKTITNINRGLLVVDSVEPPDGLRELTDRIMRAAAIHPDRALKEKTKQMASLVAATTSGRSALQSQGTHDGDRYERKPCSPRIAQSPLVELDSGPILQPPRSLEIPGLAGGLAGRGLELLQKARWASRKTPETGGFLACR